MQGYSDMVLAKIQIRPARYQKALVKQMLQVVSTEILTSELFDKVLIICKL
jgi:hypothetical protein